MKKHVAISLVFAAFAVIIGPLSGQTAETWTGQVALSTKDYSYAYWLNGWRKAKGDTSPNVLCFETGHYGFALDLGDLTTPRFGLLADEFDYRQSLAMGAKRLASLPAADLTIDVALGSNVYRAVTCESLAARLPSNARMWESGRIAQHFDLQDLTFRDDAGTQLACFGTLDMVGWPGSLTFTAELSPDFIYTEGPCMGVVGDGLCVIDKHLDFQQTPESDPEIFTAELWVNRPKNLKGNGHGWLLCKDRNERTKGNYGFSMQRDGSVHAVLNVDGGRDTHFKIKQRGALSSDEWHHLALTYDGNIMRFYVDGREQGNHTIGKKRIPSSGVLRIGNRGDGHGKVASGLYDQLRVWRRALGAAEIKAHAAKPAVVANRNGLVLEENFGSSNAFKLPVWNDAALRLAFKTGSGQWQQERAVAGAWSMGERKALTLTCNLGGGAVAKRAISGALSTSHGQQFPVQFDPTKNAYVANVTKLKRSFRGGYVKITDYDAFDIVLNCADDHPAPVPFLLDLRGPANITGLVPILCHMDGTPTGVPVQLSKNWHYAPMGSYLRAYCLVPVEQGQNHYRLRIPYGFYGTLPSASHAQLCLIGYGGNQRWDQLALACGGESITFDVDMSLTEVAVCDVRSPLGRKGETGNQWNWGDAGWGADWLGVFGAEKQKLTFAEMKTAYLSHGPCLSDVIYKGAYGSQRDVLLDAHIQLPRTDDYARTFQTLNYRFQRKLETANTYLLKRHARAFDRVVAYGNAAGLIAEVRVTGNLKKGDLLVPPTALKGAGPWWVAFPERSDELTGYVSWVIRDYASSFGGKTVDHPTLMVRVAERVGDQAKLETLLVPPPEVTAYNPGDWVRLDTEWVHLVTHADNYGGPNDAYRQHLVENPRSWKTTYREVTGNDLKMDVVGGRLRQNLPIVVFAEKPVVSVTIQGGVGYVPIRFEGLATAERYSVYEIIDGNEKKLDQAVHGNDFWQTDYDAESETFKMTFNLPLDGKPTSRWVLKQE